METDDIRVFVVCKPGRGPDGKDLFLGRELKWVDDLGMARFFAADQAAWLLHELRDVAAIQVWLNFPAEDSQPARHGQRGMALLMELLIVCAVMLIMAATSVPAIYQLHLDDQQSDAKARVQRIAAAKAAITVCTALPNPPGCTPSAAVQALVPTNGTSLTVNGYTFSESADGTTYSATPVNAQAGQQAYSVGPTDVVYCGGSPCK